MIPISVLTGFLGSGKTTILAHLLRDPALADTAVIINEFGDVGLDHDLIETSDETLVTLQTGCLCCKMQGDLVATLHDLLVRREAGSIPSFSRIVLETSGMADPAPILHGLMIDEVLAHQVSLARVLTVVDGVNGKSTLQQRPEARKQVAVADRIAISKLDLASGDDRAPLCSALDGLNAQATRLEVSNGKLAATNLFPAAGQTTAASIDAIAIAGEHDDTGHHAHEGDAIVTFSIVRDAPVAAVALSLFLEALADHCGADLYRMKGLVCVAEHINQPAVIHGVQHVFNAPVWLDAWPGDDKRTRIVFIGRAISERWVRALLDAIEIEVDEQQAGEQEREATA